MTQMLASVGTPAEAETVLAAGADIIDLADHAPHSTEAGFHDVIRRVVVDINRRRPVSASAGGRSMPPDQMIVAIRSVAATGVDYVKVVMTSDGADHAAIGDFTELAAQSKLLAMFLADRPPDLALLPLLARGGFVGAMLDIRSAPAGGLLDRFGLAGLRDFVEACHAAGLVAGLAGALEAPDIPRLLVLAPDLLGFREALRAPAGATGALDPVRVHEIRGLIPPDDTVPGSRGVDYRLLTSRFHTPAANEDPPVDLVFVEDLVLPVSIGTYGRERGAPQKVCFAVTASVIHTGRAAEDMRDVFSYDLITDGIRMLVGSGHIPLVETLAERIAAMVLGHARVLKVVVRVEKLETGSGTVGVEIERRRAMTRAADRPVVPPMTADGAKGGTA